MKNLLKLFLFTVMISVLISPVYSNVKLPRILSNNMVLQRNTDFRIWGWADKGEKVTVLLNDVERKVKAGKDGNWSVLFPAMKEGGPYTMLVKGKNEIKLTNIMFGDVWVCSGQSNMEFPLSQANDADNEIASANYPDIRLFQCPHNVQFVPVDDVESDEWQACTPETIRNFSAVGYFFGRNIYKNINVPIGLLFTAWGGTNIETWTSRESISQVKDFEGKLQEMKNYDPEKVVARRKTQIDSVLRTFGTDEKGMVGDKAVWADPGLDASTWKNMDLPVLWESAGLYGLDGIVWFRKEFQLPQDVASKGLVLYLGPIDDSDITWVNGEKVGETINKYNEDRIYKVPADILKPGKNIVTIRVEDTGGGGGVYGKPEQLKIVSGDFQVTLAGSWKFRFNSSDIKVDMSSFVGPNSYPTLLYNGMIHPFLNFSVTGAIWYQGESNADRAYQYRTLFPLMINDWRTSWNNPEMSFMFVQLANYMKPPVEPGESEWAELREAQLMTLTLPKTGMAVIIDIGEADDIHPKNKQDVGKRLALAALKITYGEDIVHSGPIYKSMNISGNKVTLDFDYTASGLNCHDRYGYLKAFTIAGKDRRFYWAKAYIENNKVVVCSDLVANPVAVRYAWADNPDDANLYNNEGLPASPFRTDEWPGVTINNK
jgi:sialate O-acetylesterase